MRFGAFNKLMRSYMLSRHRRIVQMTNNPHRLQSQVLRQLVRKAQSTEWGKKCSFSKIRVSNDFHKTHPVVEYDQIKPMIDRMMLGEKNILWPGQTKWFAKSSGTTGNKSKFIPVSGENLRKCHIRSNWDAVCMYYQNAVNARLFATKSLVMGGSLTKFENNSNCYVGDISAIMLHNMPSVGKPFYTPDFETALMEHWDEKIDRMVRICSQEDVVMLAGVPSWTLVLINAILDYTGKENLSEVWPNLELYFHGGVGFGPYREQFKRLLPTDMNFLEIYNATEGFFAAQDTLGRNDMLLLLDNGIYYEFIPSEEWHSDNPVTIPLEDIELGKQYAMIVSTNAGLWRYKNGDTIKFTSKYPYRIQVTGRIKQHINVFGEELMIDNTEQAITEVSKKHNVSVREYTAGPIFMNTEKSGAHEWIIEFDKKPKDIGKFAQNLDKRLQQLNSDYEAKRFQNMTLAPLKLNVVPTGTFMKWMKENGKLGGQHKVPRLSNERTYLEQIIVHSKKNHE